MKWEAIMTLSEAQSESNRINLQEHKAHSRYTAKVVRILSASLDPVKPGDNGWDVEVTTL